MKIRRANKKAGTLEVTLEPAMKNDGYVETALFDWVKENGEWKPKLRPKQQGAEENVPTEGAQIVSSP